MRWEDLLTPEVQVFIKEHEKDDVRDLGLKKAPNKAWPYPLILDQIKVRQKAKLKTPDLYDTNGIVFPSSSTFEQASSSVCAIYKAGIAESSGGLFVDLTAGCGVDSYHMAKGRSGAVLVERDEHSAALLKHNMEALKAADLLDTQVDVLNVDAVDYVQDMGNVDLVFIDPQRREEGGRKGLYDLASCSPDITALMPVLSQKTKKLIVKTSPFLDIDKAVQQLGAVTQVYVVEWRGECKEVLYLIDFDNPVSLDDISITAVMLNDDGSVEKEFCYRAGDERRLDISDCYGMPSGYIHEPGPAFQKSGGFKSIVKSYGVKKLHPNTHLYISGMPLNNFPGKSYKIIDIFPVKFRALPVVEVDLAVRNFPEQVKTLKKRLGLVDGGNHRVYATTTYDDKRRLVLCLK